MEIINDASDISELIDTESDSQIIEYDDIADDATDISLLVDDAADISGIQDDSTDISSSFDDSTDISAMIEDTDDTDTAAADSSDISAIFDDPEEITPVIDSDEQKNPETKGGKHYQAKQSKGSKSKKKGKNSKSNKKGKNSALLTVLLIIFAAVFVFSAYKLISIKLAMKNAADDFNDISNQFHGEKQYTDEKDEPKPISNAERFAEMRKINPDIALWITIDGTVLDYPVMYTPGNPEYYLHLDFYENYSYSGTPFIGSGCTPDSSSMILYGHCMKDGSMFRTLLEYEQYQFYKDHPVFKIETPDGTEVYDIISVFHERVHYSDEVNVFRYYNYVGDLDESTFNEYISKIKSISLHDIGATAEYGDRIISLSTCHYADEDARLVVVGVKR